MKKLMLLTLLMFTSVLSSQEFCWKINTIEKNKEIYNADNSEICFLTSKDTLFDLEGEKFLFKYISHKDIILLDEEALEIKAKLDTNIFYILIFSDELGIMVLDRDRKSSVWYYNR